MRLKTKFTIAVCIMAIVAMWYVLGIIKALLPVILLVAFYYYVKRLFKSRKGSLP